MTGFRILDHTADIGIRATGDSLPEAFANAARGMFSIVTDLKTIRRRESHRISAAAPDLDALLVNWLNELIYRFEADGLLFTDFAIDSMTEQQLAATCTGERVDPQRHHMKTGVKAATYHGLEVTRGNPCSVRVILDI